MGDAPGLPGLGERTGGVWTRAEALKVVSPDVLRRLLRSGTWQRLLPGTYTDGGHEPDAEQRGWAAVRATAIDAVVCGRSAARLWGLPLIDDDDPALGRWEAGQLEVSGSRALGELRGRDSSGRPLRVTRRRLALAPAEVVRLPSGLLVTNPARTALVCAGELRPDALVCLLDDGLHRGLFDRSALTALLDERPTCAGSSALRSSLDVADARAESPGESIARLVLLPVLPGLVPQVELRDEHGRVLARFDLGDEQARFAFESDGKAGHAGAQMVAKDRQRDRRTEQRGWWTERGTWYELRRRPDRVRQQALDRHAWWLRQAA